MTRMAIVSDNEGVWYVRRIRLVEHDLDRNEKIYRCDQPLGGPCTLQEATGIVSDRIDARITDALEIAKKSSRVEGDKHRAWAIDQMVRALCGAEEIYTTFISEYEQGGEYEWDGGIPP